jgi:hypothetical protein
VRLFIRRYQLDEGQAKTAWSILRELEARAGDYRRGHREEMAKVPEHLRLGAPEYAPIRAMFDELQRRLKPIPTDAQRRRADADFNETRTASQSGGQPSKTPPPE